MQVLLLPIGCGFTGQCLDIGAWELPLLTFSGDDDGNNSGSDSDVDDSESTDVRCAHNFIRYNKT